MFAPKTEIEIKLNDTWFEFCPHIDTFRVQLSQISNITVDRIHFLNFIKYCSKENGGHDKVALRLYVSKNSSEKCDISNTNVLKMRLMNVESIDGFKVSKFCFYSPEYIFSSFFPDSYLH